MNVRGESSGDVRSLPVGDPEELARGAVGRAYKRPLVELDGGRCALRRIRGHSESGPDEEGEKAERPDEHLAGERAG